MLSYLVIAIETNLIIRIRRVVEILPFLYVEVGDPFVEDVNIRFQKYKNLYKISK